MSEDNLQFTVPKSILWILFCVWIVTVVLMGYAVNRMSRPTYWIANYHEADTAIAVPDFKDLKDKKGK